jgi:hypothetical protein
MCASTCKAVKASRCLSNVLDAAPYVPQVVTIPFSLEALRARRERQKAGAGEGEGGEGAGKAKGNTKFAAASLQFGTGGTNPGEDTARAAERELERVRQPCRCRSTTHNKCYRRAYITEE